MAAVDGKPVVENPLGVVLAGIFIASRHAVAASAKTSLRL